MTSLFRRDAISRARQFIELARKCSFAERDEHEMFVEAAIVYGRAALHRLQAEFKSATGWNPWWDGLRQDPSVEFFRQERDFLLKEGPTKVGQVIRVGSTSDQAEDFYYFEDPDTPATDTISRHLDRIEQLVQDAQKRFGQS